MFEIRTIHLSGYSSGKTEEPLNQNKRFNNQLWIGVTATYARSEDQVYFVIRITWSRPFLIALMDLFSYMLPCFHQNLSKSHHQTNTHYVEVLNLLNQMSSKRILSPGQDCSEIQICDQQIFQRQHAQHWVLFRCWILLPKFNSWKLIAARWIPRQHNINAITTYFKYLIRQFNLILQWDLILQLATFRVKEHSNF